MNFRKSYRNFVPKLIVYLFNDLKMLNVYYLRLSDYQNRPDDFFLPYVSEKTAQEVRHYKNPSVRRTKLMGEGMVRLSIRALWGLTDDAYRLRKGEHGKPYVDLLDLSVFYNLSHSGDYIVAVFAESEVGIDIERISRPRLEVARRFFHPGEIRQLEDADEASRKGLFFHYWSVKESFLKYIGCGLSSPLSSFEVCCQGSEIRIMKENAWQPVYIRPCAIDEGYNCYVCSENTQQPEIEEFQFPVV